MHQPVLLHSKNASLPVKASWVYEYRVMHKDGSLHYFIANATPILNAAGQVISIQGISHDITKQKEADKALKKSEEQYRTLFDKAMDGIFLIDMDGNIYDANNAAAAMHGYSIDEMKTKSLGTLVCPAERPLIAERTKAIFEKAAFNFEAKHCHKDGHILLLDVVANSIELNGEKFVLAFLRDIREQKQAAIALKDSEEKFSKIFHLSPDVILLSRISDGVIVDVNERAFDLAGYRREEVLGMTTMKLNGWDDLSERDRYVTQLMQHGHVSSFEKKFKIKSGEYKDTTISGELIELNGEKLILTVIHDISEQKNTARLIIESEELLNQTGQLAKVGGWTFNVLTNEIIWTKETYRMCELPLDYKPDVASILQFYHPDDRETINQLVHEAVQSGKSFEAELRGLTANGKVAWINTVINAIEEQGRVVKVVGALQDITERKNAEVAIRESEDKFSKAFHASPDVLMLTSFPEGTIIDANQTVFEMFGYHRNEMLGKTTVETKIWTDNATRDRYIDQLKKQGSVHNFETAFNTRQGVLKFALVSAEFIELQGKRILLSIIRNITKHKEAEKKIQESETKYRQLFERNPMPVFLYQTSDLRIVDINEATIKHYGYSREEFKQMTIRDMRPASELEKLNNYFSSPRPKGFINAGLWKHKKKDGTIIDVEVVSNDFEVNNMPCRIVLCKDVTEKQKAEDALAESERKYRNMVELNQAGIYQSSVNGEILSCNSAFTNMLGYEIHDLVQNKKADIFYFKNTERDKFIQHLQKNNGLNNYEAELKHRDGHAVNILENCFLRKDAKGNDIIEGTMIDITRRKRAEKEIKKLNRLYLLITQINDLILKSTSNNEIYEAVCRIAVKQGKFRMAWIGLVDKSAELIKPLTWAGHEEGYLQEINISTSDDPEGLGPTGKAVKLARYHFSNDIMNDRSMLPWKEKALAHGFYSSISLPIFVQGKVIAAFTMYAAESFFFNASEIKLLEEVTANISFALDKIWIENMRKMAEEALKNSMKEIADYKYAIDQSAIVSITDNYGVIKYVNNNFCNLYGFTQEEAIGKNHNTIINSGYHPHSFWKNFWKTIQQGKVLKAEVCNMAKDGSLHWQDTTIIPFLDLEGKPYQYIAIRTDITKKRKLEIELAAEQLNHQKVITEVTIQAQEKERNQLGRELHDNINQILATVKMYLGLAKSKKRIPEDLVEKGYNYLDDAIKEIRTLSHSLVAPSLGDVGLEEALTDITYAINAGSGVHLKVINHMDKRKKIDANKKIILYRIVQEQINNITKYAKAASATILLETKGKNIHLSITDDGVGFDVNQKARGIGLQNIQSRVEFYAGKMDIISAPGKGCTLKIAVPY
jgi:PAS domain S-box-containing protein